MIAIKTTVKAPKITLKVPTNDPRFWQGLGTEVAGGIVKRTQAGRGVDNRGFKPYTPATKKQRIKKGRSPFVNLTVTGQMLNSIYRGIRAKGNRVIIKMTGEQAFKAFENESRGRVFFAIGRKQGQNAIKRAQTWIRKKNKMR